MGALANTIAGGGEGAGRRWDEMNARNIKMWKRFVKRGQRQFNVGRQVGVRMVEVLH